MNLQQLRSSNELSRGVEENLEIMQGDLPVNC